MNNSKKSHDRGAWKTLLREAGLELSPGMEAKLERHTALVREWNKVASLVSARDSDRLETQHLVDSLSLAPVIRDICAGKGRLLDIGSGGGYPAIPLKVVLPGLEVVLVERSARKVGFLRKVLGALELRDIEIVAGEFPEAVMGMKASVITARAVERPRRVLKDTLRWVETGAVFFCQSGDPAGEAGGMFHVERVVDTWSRLGLRRGELYLLRKC